MLTGLIILGLVGLAALYLFALNTIPNSMDYNNPLKYNYRIVHDISMSM